MNRVDDEDAGSDRFQAGIVGGTARWRGRGAQMNRVDEEDGS